MLHPLFTLLLSAKSLLGLSAAYEIASTGRLIEAMTLGSVAVTPTVWSVIKKAAAWPVCDDIA
ncbi:MAG: hypothetical protein AB7O26_06770 [Planctomycetaceae bacterium]